MKKIRVTIVGDSPLIMHNPSGMRQSAPGKGTNVPPAAHEAAASRYLVPDGKPALLPDHIKGDEYKLDKRPLALKSDHIHRCLSLASAGYKDSRKKSMVPLVNGSIDIQPEWISLGSHEYTVDVRRVVLGRGPGAKGILRARALVFPWKATFELHYDEGEFSDNLLKALRDGIFVDAGKRKGLLDYRPDKGGKYGRFHVEAWEV